MTQNNIINRLVIDTNVCLDLFIFNDPRCANLMARLQAGDVEAVTCERCKNEWLRVLEYPQLALDAAMREKAHHAFQTYFTLISPDAREDITLPICRDKDDQKFLELARDANAKTLISKDKALLRLARKTQNLGLFFIIKPEQFT